MTSQGLFVLVTALSSLSPSLCVCVRARERVCTRPWTEWWSRDFFFFFAIPLRSSASARSTLERQELIVCQDRPEVNCVFIFSCFVQSSRLPRGLLRLLSPWSKLERMNCYGILRLVSTNNNYGDKITCTSCQYVVLLKLFRSITSLHIFKSSIITHLRTSCSCFQTSFSLLFVCFFFRTSHTPLLMYSTGLMCCVIVCVCLGGSRGGFGDNCLSVCVWVSLFRQIVDNVYIHNFFLFLHCLSLFVWNP